MLPGRRTSGWILKQMASGCKRLDTSCSSPHPHPNTHHTVLSPNRLGFPEACPGCRLPTRKIAVRADSPTPTQGPGSGSGSLQIPIHPPSQELSSPEHLGPQLSALGLGNARRWEASPWLPHMYARMVLPTIPELAEGLGMCPGPLAGLRQAGGFRKLFNLWALTHPAHHQAGSSAHGSDVRGQPWHSAILPAHTAAWQSRQRERGALQPSPLESQPFGSRQACNHQHLLKSDIVRE